MASYLSPGLTVKETDASFTMAMPATSVAGMMGIARKGPINDPQLVTSWDHFVRTFGPLMADSHLTYAARAFFDNGGSQLYVVRVAHYTTPTDRQTLTAQPATVTLPSDTNEAGWTLQAASPGTWGDDLIVTITPSATDTHAFTVTVRQGSTVLETFTDLVMTPGAARVAPTVIARDSELLHVPDTAHATTRPEAGDYPLTGGHDGLEGLADSDFIGDPSQHTGLYALDRVDTLTMLMLPGLTTAPVLHAAMAYAEQRKDLMVIAEAPDRLTPTEAVAYRQGQPPYTHAAFSSSYAALYYPWLTIHDPLTGLPKAIPPCGAVAGCYARNDYQAQVWSAPAGSDRGRVRQALSVTTLTNRAERDVLYPAGLNVIAVFPDSGVTLWGQRTLLAQPSALDRINVRRLMLMIEKAIAMSSRFVVFEPNHPTTWQALARVIRPFLQTLKDQGGVMDYAFQCNEATNPPALRDRHQLIARVFVQPTQTAEYIEIQCIATDSGVVLSEQT